MTSIVKDIKDAMLVRLAAVLTSSTQLDYTIDISKNNFNNDKDRFGINPKEAAPSVSITKAYTLAHKFEIVLVTDFMNDHDSSKQEAQTLVLYDRMHEMFIDLFQSRIGLNGIVLNVNEPDIAEPEYLKSTAILRGTLTVTYRQAV